MKWWSTYLFLYHGKVEREDILVTYYDENENITKVLMSTLKKVLKENRMKIIEIQKELVIEQDGKKIILEKGDRIEGSKRRKDVFN
jgi:hypothetical protein